MLVFKCTITTREQEVQKELERRKDRHRKRMR